MTASLFRLPICFALVALVTLALPGVLLAQDDGQIDRFRSTDSFQPSPDTTIPEARIPTEDFLKGTWSFQAYGSVTVGEDDGWMYQAHIGAGYFLRDGFSINLEAVGGRIHASEEAGEDGGKFPAAGFDLLLRWHVLRAQDWSFYIDGGCGVMVSSESFPAHGTHFNFTPQLGIGATVRVYKDARLMVGARWHHVSNAGVYGNGKNPGYEGLMSYAGLMIPF